MRNAIHDDGQDMATADEMAGNSRDDATGFSGSFDPAEHTVSFLNAEQLEDEARDRAAAEGVIRIVENLERTGGRGFRAVRSREEDR